MTLSRSSSHSVSLPLAFGLSVARSRLARRWPGSSDYLPSLWVRSAFIKQLAIPESRRLETNVQRLDVPAPAPARDAEDAAACIMKPPTAEQDPANRHRLPHRCCRRPRQEYP